jgi:UDP-2,3-diacylglucosamine pyrophosphatase LpxH
MLDAVIISDLHLGSDNCQAAQLCEFLGQIEDGTLPTARLILNGDVFDSLDFRRLTDSHHKVLAAIRRLSKRVKVVWLCGNHEGSAEVVSRLLGVAVRDEYVLRTGGRKALILHGHVFDMFIDSHPVLTWLGDTAYFALQRIDSSYRLARWAKKCSKVFLSCARKVQERATARAREKGCSAVCCGHTHLPTTTSDLEVDYFNSGCWTEKPCSYLSVADGAVDLHFCDPATDPARLPAQPQQEPVLAAA